MTIWIILAICAFLLVFYRLFTGEIRRVVEQADELRINRNLVRKLYNQLDKEFAQKFTRQLDPKQQGPDLNFLANLIYYSTLFNGTPSNLGWIKKHFESLGCEIDKSQDMAFLMITAFNMEKRTHPKALVDAITKIEESELYQMSYTAKND
ncbi:hypothetical protein ACFOD1_07520 [Pseudidiomarina halophila]|uniref:hypothetical protein n=1 Tax=Pseudidiomarina halophila TaxID=1449799 RepID=UPI000F8959FE|nr:hypothetical protein [Pseudidiomarina halophila]